MTRKSFNNWKNKQPNLESFTDSRYDSDIFYDVDINHVVIISSEAGAIMGNHWHKQTTQWTLVTKGELEYWHKPVESNEPAQCEILGPGDFVKSDPNEIHAFKMLTDNEFIAFSAGLRGGKDYEKDTFRCLTPIVE